MISYYINKALRKILLAPAIKNSKLHKTVRIGSLCNVSNSKLGKYSYLGDNTSISYTTIGNFTSISSNCIIGGGEHPTDWVSTSPVFNSNPSILRVNFSKTSYNPYKGVVIGNDVWIGTNVKIKSGVTISDGAVIGMGSVVTKDVGAFEIWAGNPARIIKKRFDDRIINRLLISEWWNWEDEKIKKYSEYFNSPKDFIDCLGEVNET